MTTRPYELLARFGKEGKIAGCHVRMITEVDGKEYEGDPIPLADATHPEFRKFAEAFAASAIAENEILKKDKGKLTSDLASITTERDGLVEQVSAITTERDTAAKERADAEQAAKDLAEQHAKELEAEQQAKAETEKRLASLLTQLPYDPRVISSDAFFRRLLPDELLLLFTSEDPITQSIGKMLADYKSNQWRVEMDSVDMQQAMGYLLQSKQVTEDRIKQLLQDSTRDEAPTKE